MPHHLSASVLLSLALVFALQADATFDGWLLGQPGQTCTEACLGSMPCFVDSMTAVTTSSVFNFVNAQLGNPMNCASTHTKNFVHAPSVSGVDECNVNGASSSCDSGNANPTTARFCCCSATGCALPTPVACTYSEWTTFSSCSADCGSGSMTRTRDVLSGPTYGGDCGATSQSVPCGMTPCPRGWVKAVPNQSCTTACQGFERCNSMSSNAVTNAATFAFVANVVGVNPTCTKYNVNPFTHAPSYLGSTCYLATGTSTCGSRFVAGVRFCCCSTGVCPVGPAQDCAVGPWAAWTNARCSVSCGGGIRFRRRQVTAAPSLDGQACPPLSESQTCNLNVCPVDCAVDEWAPWTSCSASCGVGSQSHTRALLRDQQGTGAFCPSLGESQSCGTPNTCNNGDGCDADEDCASAHCLTGTCVECLTNDDCTNHCEDNQCTISAVGEHCTTDVDCTSGLCDVVNWVCQAHAVDAPSNICAESTDCTSNNCDLGAMPGMAMCVANFVSTGASVCSNDSDCTSGSCDDANWVCQPNSVDGICQDATDCTSGLCDVVNWVCQAHAVDAPSNICAESTDCTSNNCDLGAMPGMAMCVANFVSTGASVCSNDSDCTSGSCDDAKWVCQPNSVYGICQDATDCTSHHCDGSVCVAHAVNDAPNKCLFDSDCTSATCDTNTWECVPHPVNAPSAVCANDSDCTSHSCDLSLLICVPHPADAADASCADNSDCTSGNCDDAMFFCMPHSVDVANNICSNDSDCSSGLCDQEAGACKAHAVNASNNICANDSDCTSGVCSLWQCVAHGIGGTCANASDCTSQFCSGGTCTAHSAAGSLACAENSDCTSNLCDINATPKRCLTRSVGFTCGSNSDCTSRNCVSMICTAHSIGYCEANSDCSGSTMCNLTTKSCALLAGAVCTSNSQCASNSCPLGAAPRRCA